MAHVISISSQKGGTGKTSTTGALGSALTKLGYKVLLIDLDGQANLSFSMNAKPDKPTTFDVLSGRAEAAEAVQRTPSGDLLPASQMLSTLELELAAQPGKELRLRHALKTMRSKYHFILIDTPPALGLLTLNALTAAGHVILPACADVYSLQGVGQLNETLKVVRKYSNPKLQLSGILLVRYHLRTVLNRDLAAALRGVAKELGTFVYKSTIRDSVVIREAQAQKQTLFDYAPKSPIAADYLAFTKEFLRHMGGNKA